MSEGLVLFPLLPLELKSALVLLDLELDLIQSPFLLFAARLGRPSRLLVFDVIVQLRTRYLNPLDGLIVLAVGKRLFRELLRFFCAFPLP